MAAARAPSVSGLPAGLVPPPKVALARAVTRMPRAGTLSGTLSYEPKWDGYRCIAIHDDHGVTLWSRQGKELTGYFPELTAAFASEVPPGCVVDGEAVIWAGGRLDFSALQQRLGAGAKTLSGLVRQTPASYVAFDVLAVAGHDARALPLSERRALLEELARGWAPPLSLSPATTDPDEAARWFEDLPHTGIEGLVIKGIDQPYTPGARSWLKLKHRETVEIICGAVIGPITEPREVVAGLVLDGELRIVGRSTPLKTAAARELARWLQPPRGAHPWPPAVKGTTLDRFNRDKEPVALTLVEPVAVEVSADTAWSGRSFRHPLRVLRARPELSPTDIILPDMLRPLRPARANTVEQ
ncbi:ATP-dependent DNA ligase [Pseudarthrobacter sp. NIBRBAC000502770]|uniref:ATP-dependent DNA ligase n=1 Tax=Pseudarthrobacter sp. NIBRBAC000502770 TaxID=2590785 RepID=UPI00114018E2|nr:ATP-dependent DNA ligase [Pseudarthrobacter sp. NIBRBAC000502770]QDG87056.1 ATP-dependent DNA ligase [Pseudarthrobacter sp. NIBRBAC000502770]